MRLAGTLLTWSVLIVTCGVVHFCVSNKINVHMLVLKVVYIGARRFGLLKFRTTTYIHFDSATSKVRTVHMTAK
jgi:hypothetical protein